MIIKQVVSRTDKTKRGPPKRSDVNTCKEGSDGLQKKEEENSSQDFLPTLKGVSTTKNSLTKQKFTTPIR